jgi:hypothetical protein
MRRCPLSAARSPPEGGLQFSRPDDDHDAKPVRLRLRIRSRHFSNLAKARYPRRRSWPSSGGLLTGPVPAGARSSCRCMRLGNLVLTPGI